jgi:Family of unknown function (DUF6252)
MKTLKNLAYCLWLVIAVLELNACGGTSDTVSAIVPPQPLPPLREGTGTIKATINGDTFIPDRDIYCKESNLRGFAFIAGSFYQYKLELSALPLKVGKYQISAFASPYGTAIPIVGASYDGTYAKSGEVSVIEITNTKLKGTFKFSGTNQRGETINITDGVFEYNF